MTDIEALVRFLVEARRATYAGGGGDVSPLLPGSAQLEYRSGSYLYRDVYFGQKQFIGIETVYYRDEPVWGMAYYGGLTDEVDRPADEVYGFLRKALQQVNPERPYRGPERFREGELTYLNASYGEVSRFSGQEQILSLAETVYRLRYMGGVIVG